MMKTVETDQIPQEGIHDTTIREGSVSKMIVNVIDTVILVIVIVEDSIVLNHIIDITMVMEVNMNDQDLVTTMIEVQDGSIVVIVSTT